MPDNLNIFNDLLPIDSSEENKLEEQNLFFDLIDYTAESDVESESEDISLESVKIVENQWTLIN